ncbi:hypothetical protein P3J6_90092 [Pseudoalteromonas sp. 3J6]|nr:hypothetical protein P3J6_90092 [Pseudoalteromonas sp. 3J6]
MKQCCTAAFIDSDPRFFKKFSEILKNEKKYYYFISSAYFSWLCHCTTKATRRYL